jgi:membrane protein DedA with SNARE-associated domain
VHSFTRWLIGVFASPLGVFALAALDSTVFFSVPFGIDAVVIILAARLGRMAWIRYVPAKRLERVRQKVHQSGAVALAALSLIPPPFPFTPFALAAGALEVPAVTFFTAMTACRLLRFGIESWLAATYGRRIIRWLDADLFQDVVIGCIALTLILTTVSIVRIVRSSKPHAAAA